MSSIQADYLRNLVLKLSRGRSVQEIIQEIRQAARKLTGADGATFILKDRDKCYYVDEDAISPLWKGEKFPIDACISGWSMMNKKEAIIKDIYKDSRIPINAYKVTFVKSLVMVPINIESPFGAIGNYWATEHEASEEEIRILTFLAKITAIALQNVEILDQLENSLTFSNQSQKIPDEFMKILSYELHASKSSGFAISNEIEKFSSMIQEVNVHRNNVSKLKKVIYEISLKQLHEMDDSLRDYLQVRAL